MINFHDEERGIAPYIAGTHPRSSTSASRAQPNSKPRQHPVFDLLMDPVHYTVEDYFPEDLLNVRYGEFVVSNRPGPAVAVDETKIEQYRIDRSGPAMN